MRIRLVHGLIVATACTACLAEEPGPPPEEVSQPNSAPATVVQDAPVEYQPTVTAAALLNSPLPPRHAGPPPAEVFGYMRPDGVIVPQLALTGAGWVPIFDLAGFEDPGPWSAATTYFHRDSSGAVDTVSVDGLVAVCCAYEGNDAWAHHTERSPPDVENYLPGGLGHVTTSLEGDAPFVASQRTPPQALQQLLDSLSNWPDSVETHVEVHLTAATLDGSSHTFLRAVQSNARFYSGCYVIEGWLPASDPERIDVLSAGADDCEGKGHTYHGPRALLRRSGELLLVIDLSGWGDGTTQVWRHMGGTRWNTTFEEAAATRQLEPEPAPWRFDVVGLLPSSGTAVQHFAWNGSRWLRTQESLPEGSMVTSNLRGTGSVLTLGQGQVGVGDASGPVVYEVLRGTARPRRNASPQGPLGYFVSVATGTYPFLRPRRDTNPLPWPDLLLASGTTLSHDTLHWDAQTWTARLDSVSVSFVALDYKGDDRACSHSRAQATGWILKKSDGYAGAAIRYGECQGRGLEARQPYAFIRRGGRYFVLMHVLRSEGDDAELWEVTETEVTNVTPPRGTVDPALQ